LFRVQIYDEF